MILVTGGCFQGKTEYALEKFQISRDEAADGEACPLHMHLYDEASLSFS